MGKQQKYSLSFEGMCFANPNTDLEWHLRYGRDLEKYRFSAASAVGSYRQLIWDSQKVRNKKIAKIRELAKKHEI